MPRNILNDTIFVTFYFVSTELQNELTICIIMYYYGYFCVHYLASDNISVIRSRTLLWRKTRSISKHNTASFCVTMKRTRDLGDYDGSSGSSKRPMDSPKRVSCHARDYVGSPFPQFRKPQVIRCQYKMSCISQCRSINDQFININPR